MIDLTVLFFCVLALFDTDYWTGAKRMIPKLVDIQTYATLAKWFGISDEDIDYIFPDLVNFESRDLGFLG